MPITRNKKLVPDALLKAFLRSFETSTGIGVGGGLSYQRIDFQEFFEILPDAFLVTPPISRAEAIRLFSQALNACRTSGTMTGEAIMARATLLQREALGVPKIPYTLWTKFRATGMAHAPGFRLDWRGVRARTTNRLPQWLERDQYLMNGVGRIYPRKPDHAGHIVLTCEDRDEDRAVDRMMDGLKLMLGLANMYETWGRRPIWGGRNSTDGGLWLGPYQFVFRRRTFRGDEHLWYNPDYDEEAWKRHPREIDQILRIVPTVRKALTALDRHPLANVLIRAVMLLQDGFASRDTSIRMLRYWSALEQLYVESDLKTRSNEKVLERALFAEREPALSKWKLEHIARLRNDYVHAGMSGDDLHDLCQFLRELVVRHVNFWIFQGGSYQDHAAVLAFAKLPVDRNRLVAMRDLIDRRIAFVEKAPAAERS